MHFSVPRNCLRPESAPLRNIFNNLQPGSPWNLENLESLEFFDEPRENLEKLGKNIERARKSGISQAFFLSQWYV